MAAILPGAVRAPIELATLFSGPSKDWTNNNLQTLLNPFLHTLDDDTDNVSTDNTREILTVVGHRGFSIVAIILSQGQAYPYLLPHHWEHALIGPEQDLDEKSSPLMEISLKTKSHRLNSCQCLPLSTQPSPGGHGWKNPDCPHWDFHNGVNRTVYYSRW